MNNQQINAVATADAHLKNAGLPTYSEVVASLRECAETLDRVNHMEEHRVRSWVEAEDNADALLDRIPA